MIRKELFFLQEKGEHFSGKMPLVFFIGDTDPGILTMFQKQPLCFFHFTVFHFNFSLFL